ncbi:MAG: hypothetical protein JO246_10170 [Frankiaceae bacterium]|nr:hypothetical protein [Frankiaceae bacterium]MBV9872153.1 hypothetical protein [Frankiaceae bacterium]
MKFRVAQVEPPVDEVTGDDPWDYADCFAVTLDEPRTQTAEEWMRAAITQVSPAMLTAIRLIHRHVLRFDLGRSDPGDYFGWAIAVAGPEVATLAADGSLIRGLLVARRHSPTSSSVATYVYFHRPTAARWIWTVVRPIHVYAARRLLRGAAEAISRSPRRGVTVS